MTSRMTMFAMCLPMLVASALGSERHFSSGEQIAARFGVHEVVLLGDGGVANPFDTPVGVEFTPASGTEQARTVQAFYDGANTWRARVYVSEPGEWRWVSKCAADPRLDQQSGRFRAEESALRGRLLIHPRNPWQWITENGRWFLNLNDTSYFLLCAHDAEGKPNSEHDFRSYVQDAVDHGITSFRSWIYNGPQTFNASPGGSDRHRWDDLFADAAHTQPNLDHLRLADERLRWMLDNYPDVYTQIILFPLGTPWGADDKFWKSLSAEQKDRVLRYLIARFAAYPNIFWLIVNDCSYTLDPAHREFADQIKTLADRTYPNNEALAREVGKYFEQHDPWRHPLSTGGARTLPFCFGDESWASYIHLEDNFDVGAEAFTLHAKFRKPVFLGEDRYEQDHPADRDPRDMRYFQRRLYWSWLIAGGSANYGGRWSVVVPYGQTGTRASKLFNHPSQTSSEALVGLDSVRFIRDYFATRAIELSDFESGDLLVRDGAGATGEGAPRLAHRGQAEFLIYHPHAAGIRRDMHAVTDRPAALQVDLRQAKGLFAVEWYRAADGQSQAGDDVEAGDWRSLKAPWTGGDVVVRLSRK